MQLPLQCITVAEEPMQTLCCMKVVLSDANIVLDAGQEELGKAASSAEGRCQAKGRRANSRGGAQHVPPASPDTQEGTPACKHEKDSTVCSSLLQQNHAVVHNDSAVDKVQVLT